MLERILHHELILTIADLTPAGCQLAAGWAGCLVVNTQYH